MTRIFIVDDHPLVIEGLQSMLAQLQDVEVCGKAMNGASCLGFFVRNSADVVLLDINMPGMSGVDVCRELLKNQPKLRILALTNLDQLTYLQQMKASGAVGYLLKNSSLEELNQAIESVMSGKEYWLGRQNVKESIQEHNEAMLTRREVDVLRHIAQGLTNQEIADQLFVSVSTVDSHRKNMISKLQVRNTAALIRKAIETKLI
jgi:DNA-binding NarL/FixJ family response regulator